VTHATQPEAEVFGGRLRELRQKRRFTQGDVAHRSGLTVPYISEMERGFKVPSLTTILRLAIALECKATDLVGVFDETDLPSIVAT
jgi:transcriptional regulator with XRE-family HTH domain